jgi:hypothetical protein
MVSGVNEGGVLVARLRCRTCDVETFAIEAALGPPHPPCPTCGRETQLVEKIGDRRAGADRRGPSRLQRVWDYDPRSWFDRRRA